MAVSFVYTDRKQYVNVRYITKMWVAHDYEHSDYYVAFSLSYDISDVLMPRYKTEDEAHQFICRLIAENPTGYA